jgi:hypothetical protein
MLTKRQQNIIRSFFGYQELTIKIFYSRRKNIFMAYRNDQRLFAAITGDDLMDKMREANEVNLNQVVQWRLANDKAADAWPFPAFGVIR